MAQPTPEQIQTAVRTQYREVAGSAAGHFMYPTGREGALQLGYDPGFLESVPAAQLACFCGVGHPLSLGPVSPGEAVLDVGCGAGLDLLLAARLVGSGGQVTGVDLTPQMVTAARGHLEGAGVKNARVLEGAAEALPLPDCSMDLVISSGVLNLSPDKLQACREIFRVLRPGGRLQLADMVRDGDLPAALGESLEAWST